MEEENSINTEVFAILLDNKLKGIEPNDQEI